jgi:hypothetical protein
MRNKPLLGLMQRSPFKVDLTKKSGLGPREKAFLTKEEKDIVEHEQTKYKDFENPVTREKVYEQTEKIDSK